MLFELSNDYIKKGTVREPSKLVLPSGLHLVLMNPTGTPVKKNAKCHFTHIRTNCLFIMSGLGVHVSGDILITMIEMGYDIASKGEWKRAKKDDKDKILNEYDKLKSKKPDLFDASKIDLLNFDGEIVNQQLEKEDVDQVQNPKPSDAIDTQMESPILNQVKNSGISQNSATNNTIVDHSIEIPNKNVFNLSNELICRGDNDKEPSLIALPAGITQISLNIHDYGTSKKKRKCEFLRIKANTVLLKGGILPTFVCGDILVTMFNMGYDLNNPGDWKRAKKAERSKILDEYGKLVLKNPSLFEYNRCDIEAITAEVEIRAQRKAALQEKKRLDAESTQLRSSIEIDTDKFEDKKTIKSKKSIRIDMTDSGAAISSMMSKRGGILDAVSAGVQYIEMKFRYVETTDSSALLIDLEYYGNNWLFLRDGNLVIRIDGDNRKFKPYHQHTNVQDGGKVKENESYVIKLDDLEKLSNASEIEGQIAGKSVKVPFSLTEKQKNIITEFHAAVFTGDDPLFDPGKSGKNTDDLKNTEQSVETSDPPVENNIETEIDLTAELEKLSNLQDKGLINAEEYSLAKKKLLGI